MPITHLVAARDYRRMPWKNGGGETIEIARSPDGTDLSGFDWRISMAMVASDGPFSIFPGIDRTLAVLTGEGMVLDIEGMVAKVHLQVTGDPLAFPADAPTAATLTGGPITDLNLMTRRAGFTHQMELRSLPAEEPGEEGAIVFLMLKGEGTATADDGRHWSLADTDALRLGAPGEIVRITGEGVLYRMEIRPL